MNFSCAVYKQSYHIGVIKNKAWKKNWGIETRESLLFLMAWTDSASELLSHSVHVCDIQKEKEMYEVCCNYGSWELCDTLGNGGFTIHHTISLLEVVSHTCMQHHHNANKNTLKILQWPLTFGHSNGWVSSSLSYELLKTSVHNSKFCTFFSCDLADISRSLWRASFETGVVCSVTILFLSL